MIWFTSDLHLGHESIIRMQNRPFSDVEEMNNELIHHINSVVKPTDKLYILGDVSHHISAEETSELIRRIHGRKYLIFGNHDLVQNPEKCPYNPALFEFEGFYLKLNAQGQNFILMHYPLLSWDKARNGSVMLHGHIHSDPSYNEREITSGIRRYDVGMDANGYYPVSLDTVLDWVKRTPVNPESEAIRFTSKGQKKEPRFVRIGKM